jgi:XTP/dITP diphosphohydrolase
MRLELVVATKNKKKLDEIRELLKDHAVTIRSLADYPGAPRIIENGTTFADNAIKKAVTISRYTGQLTLGEDSGLCVDSLGGSPGVHSSRFSGKNKSDTQNNLKVLKLLEDVPPSKRKAHYVCAVAVADESGLVAVTHGRCYVRIGFVPQGTYGFGYDPLFIIPKYGKTFAQLGVGIKHTISHRFHALKKAGKVIQKYIERHGKC